MRPRRSANPLLPVNSKHLRTRAGSAQCLRLAFLCMILMVLGYAFVSRGYHSNQHPQPLPSLSPVYKLSIKEQMEHRSLSGEVISTSPDPQLLHEDTAHGAAHHHIHEVLESPHADEHARIQFHRGHKYHDHRRNHDGDKHHDHVQAHTAEHAGHAGHPDATHQLAHHDAHAADVPDASHQVAGSHLSDAANTHFPDAAHQVAEAKGDGAGAAGGKKSLEDVRFIHHDQWDEKDVKAPGGHKATTTTTTTTATDTKPGGTGGLTKEEAPVVAPARPQGTGLYALAALDIDGHLQHLREFQGKVSLVVNVASACGYTDSNYKGLQALYDKYRSRGFVVLGFPCNQFGAQEAGSLASIKAFCSSKYHVTFPMFSKVNVNGLETHPVFQFLKRDLPESEGGGGGHGVGKDLTWNFNKFLVDPQGKPIRYFDSTFDQANLERDIETLLLQVPKQ